MGQQQLILVLLGIMIIGVGIAAGLGLFSSNNVASNKVAIIHDVNIIAQHAKKYLTRPASLGGGAGSYAGFTIGSKLASNANATYASTVTATEVTVVAVSAYDANNTLTVVIDRDGKLGSWTYTGDFQ